MAKFKLMTCKGQDMRSLVDIEATRAQDALSDVRTLVTEEDPRLVHEDLSQLALVRICRHFGLRRRIEVDILDVSEEPEENECENIEVADEATQTRTNCIEPEPDEAVSRKAGSKREAPNSSIPEITLDEIAAGIG